jgi:hypothetical protein
VRARGYSFDTVRGMGDWLQENGAAVLGGVVTLTVAALGLLAAEGGRGRRSLRRIKEQLEVLALMAEPHLSAQRAALETNTMGRLDRYLTASSRRWRTYTRVTAVWVFVGYAVVILLYYALPDSFKLGEPLAERPLAGKVYIYVSWAWLGIALFLIMVWLVWLTLRLFGRFRRAIRR